jgi:phosphatidylserine/phosphatidylglycerophosphate/cardiolipin synthase-like enzyme
MLEPIHTLSVGGLRAICASLRDGPLALGLSRHGLAQIIGSQAKAVHESLQELHKQGMTPGHIALTLDAIADARERAIDPQLLFDLVLSGPEVPGIPTADTAAVVQTLIENAQNEILLVGYTVHNGKKLFRRLAERMEATPALRVVFCLDIARKPADTSLASEIVRRFSREFATKHWPGSKLPEVFYHPRALAETWEERASLHAKCVIVDRRTALVTSANFTDAAQRKNIEAGVLIRYEPLVTRLSTYFESLRASGQLLPCSLDQQRPPA